jgi:predicted nuclease of predicted toxin-antitoxin system
VPVSIKVDEDLPPAVAQAFGQVGHDTSTVLEQGWSGCPDDVLLARVRAEGRWLVTAGRGFADMRQYAPGSHAGIIVLQTVVESRRRYLTLADTAARTLELERLAGCLVVVKPGRVRNRRPSP